MILIYFTSLFRTVYPTINYDIKVGDSHHMDVGYRDGYDH